MNYIIYHNPKCSKSRACLEILQEKNVDFTIREYLQESLDEEEIIELCKKIGIEPQGLIRSQSPEFEKENKNTSPAQLIVQFPQIMQRPIIESSDKAIIGRPPESLLDFIK